MHFRFSRFRYFIGLLALLVRPALADFQTADSQNLTQITTDTGSIYQQLYNFHQLWSQHISSWGGNFIKTVGNAAAKFTQEFGTNGWFPAVKASIGVIQADVGRINTALTDVNTHLELIEDHADSSRDNTESIESSVRDISSDTSSISSSVSNLLTSFSSFWDDSYFGNGYTFFNFRRLKFPKSDSSSGILNASDFDWDEYEIEAATPITAIVNLLQGNAQAWEDHFTFTASELMRLSVQQYCVEVLTNTTAQILDTNSFWYAKIYDRIPTNSTVVVSNIASNASNDWHYDTVPTSLSSSPVLQNLAPDISRDVSQSYSLTPPNLTGDFRKDVILLLAHAQQVSASSSSVNMDILTNLQVVANSILSAAAEADKKKTELQSTISTIEDEYDSHQGDLDSTEDSFKLVDNNNSAKSFLQNSQNIEAALSPLNVTDTPDSYNMVIPVTFSQFTGNAVNFGDYFNIRIDVSQIQGVCRTIRSAFGVFWWMIGFGILFGLLGKGVRLLAWISNFINPGSGNQILTSTGAKT